MRKKNYNSLEKMELVVPGNLTTLHLDANVRNKKAASLLKYLFLLTFMAFTFIANAQNIGVSSTGGTTSANYNTLKEAFDAVNAGTHTGTINISINGNTTETATASLNTSSSPSSYTSVTIKPTTTATISGNLNAAAIVKLNGADNVTIDGNISGGTSRDLTITNIGAGAASDNTLVIWVGSVSLSNPATGNTVKNCNISCTNRTVAYAGIFSGSASTINGVGLGSNNNNTYSNNAISRSRNGILLAGVASTPYDAGATISNNNIDSIGGVCVTMSNQTNYNIFSNVIDKCEGAPAFAANMRGFSFTSINSNGNVYNNTIKMLRCPYTPGGGALANYLNLASTNTASNLSIYNNSFSGAWSYGTSGNFSLTALDFRSGGGYKIYNNTFNVTETPTTTNTFQAMMYFAAAVTTANSIDIRNNIFSMQGSASNNYVIYDFHTLANASVFRGLFTNSDYNDYYTVGTTFGVALGAVVSDYKSTTQKDVNSQFIAPTFVSATNGHLQAVSGNATLNNGGTPIAIVTTDIDGNPRSKIYPDIGCDEIVYVPKISSFTSSSACIGNTVSIYGADLNASGSTVSLAGASPASTNLYKTDTISAVVASGYTSPSTDVVSVTNIYGTGSSVSSLTRVAPATYSSKSLSTGSSGDQVIISGTNLNGATGVTFNGLSASFSITNSTEIVATVPNSASSGNIIVTDACSNAVNAGSFVVVAANTCMPPSTQATSFVASSTSSVGLNGSFTAASGNPSGYLVIYSNTALVAAPSDQTTYNTGFNSSLGGIVKQVSASTNVSITGLASNTSYTVTVYAYNGGGCTGGPLYNVTSPLTYTFTTCSSVPTGITATPSVASGANQVTLDWTAPTGGGVNSLSYGVELYTDAAFTSPVSGSPFTTTAVSYTINPLNFDTKYYYKIRSNNGCYSSYATGNVTTGCGSGTVLPSTQNFDGVVTPNLPNCWTAIDNNADGFTWNVQTPFLATGIGNPYVLDYDANSTNTTVSADDWAVSPGFQLTGGTKYVVSFLQATSGATENLSVKWGNAATVSGMNAANNSGLIWSGTSLRNQAAATRYGTFTPTGTGTYYIGFYTNSPAYGGNPAGRYHYVDNFKIELAPAAPVAPSSLTFPTITSSSITINWTDNSNNEVGFNVYSSLDGTNYTLVTTVGANTTASTLSNLNASTQYYFKVTAYNFGDESAGATGSATTLSCNGVFTTNSWIGTFPIGSGATQNWNSSSNWSLGHVPTSCEDVVITLSNSNIDTTSTSFSRLYLNANATIHSFTINGTYSKPRNVAGSSATLIVFTNGYSLDVTGNLNMSLDTAAGTATGAHGIYLVSGAGSGPLAKGPIYVRGDANIGVTGTRSCAIGGFSGANNWYFYGDVTLGKNALLNYGELSDMYFEKTGNQVFTSNAESFFTPLSSYGIYNFNVGTTTTTNLTVAGSSTAYASSVVGDLTVGAGSSLTISSGSRLNRTQAGGGTITLNSGSTLTVSGSSLGVSNSNFPSNFNSYNFNANSTVIYNGTSAQTIAAGPAYGNLTINNTAGALVNGNTSVTGALTLTNGIVSTGANKLTIGINGSVVGASSSKYVNGTLAKTKAADTNGALNFEIGDGTQYTPVFVGFNGVTNSGGVFSAKTTAGVPAALGYLRSGISQTNYLNRTFTLSNNGITGYTSFAPRFYYANGDVIGATDNTNFKVADSVYGGGWSIRTTNNYGDPSSQATGITSLASSATADYLVGELDAAPSPTVDDLVTTSICEGTTFTITGTNFYAINSVKVGTTSVPFTVNSSTQITVSLPVGTGNGSVNVSNTSGTATTTNSLTTKDQPQTSVSQTSQTICSGSAITTVVLGNTNSVPGTNYSWTRSGNNISGGSNGASGNGDISGTLESSSTIPETITYTVNSSANGCAGTTVTSSVVVKASPGTVSVTPSSSAICQNLVQDLTATYTSATGSSTKSSGAISVAIPDANVAGANTTLSITDVPTGAIVTGMEVSFSATHTTNSDLAFNLVAPNGKIINLAYQKGGTGANYSNVVFSDVAVDNLATANTSNISGTYLPDGVLPAGSTLYPSNTNAFSDLYSTPNGTWRLVARDYTTNNTGSITDFNVKLYYTLNPTFSWTKVGGGYAGLYTDAGFTAYTGGSQQTVYVKNTAGSYSYNANISFNGCTASSNTATVDIEAVPNVSRTPATQTICSNTSITNIVLTSPNDPTASLTWTRDNTSNITGIAASGSGDITGTLTNLTSSPITVTFTITPMGTGSQACAGTPITASVTVNPTPLASATPASQNSCSGTAINPIIFGTTNGVSGTNYTWTRDNTSAATGIAASGTQFVSGILTNTGATTTVTFSITAVGPGVSACAGTPTTATVTVYNPATVYAMTGAGGSFCSPGAGLPVGLSNSQSGYNYQLLLNGSPIGSPVAGVDGALSFGNQVQSGTYTVIASNSGCSVPMSGSVVINAINSVTPTINLITSNTTICGGTNATFFAVATNTGNSPTYKFTVNGITKQNTSSNVFITSTLANGDIVSCELASNNICQTASLTSSNDLTMTVNSSTTLAAPAAISGSTTQCSVGGIVYLKSATTGGVWSSSNPSVASVVSVNGKVTAVANGTAIISYTVSGSNGCTNSASVAYTVAEQAAPAAITGPNKVCSNGGTISLSSTTSGGVWSSNNTNVTVNANNGLVTGNLNSTNTYSSVISYKVTNAAGCSKTATYNVDVAGMPGVPTIGYAPGTQNPQLGAPSGGFCINKTFTVVGSPAGGAWSTTNSSVLTVTSGGVVHTAALGTVSLKYTVTNSNGCSNSRSLNGTVVNCAARGVNLNDAPKAEFDFNLYPNPAKGSVSFNAEFVEAGGTIVLTDMYGKTVKTQTLSLGTNAINISNLSKGFYLVSVITIDGKKTKKLIVE